MEQNDDRGNLVLSRKPGQSVIIGENKIEIMVGEIKLNQVKLILKVDKSINIYRKELEERDVEAISQD